MIIWAPKSYGCLRLDPCGAPVDGAIVAAANAVIAVAAGGSGGDSMRVSITNDGLEVTAKLGDLQAIETLIKTLEATKLLYQPIHGVFATEYTDDEEGSEAEQRDRERDKESADTEQE